MLSDKQRKVLNAVRLLNRECNGFAWQTTQSLCRRGLLEGGLMSTTIAWWIPGVGRKDQLVGEPFRVYRITPAGREALGK